MPEWQGKNLLCFGDNLDFLTDTSLFPDGCVDLIYLDPPFNSQQDYNVLFKETSGAAAAAQIKAFEDTWTWDMEANKALTRIAHDPAVPPALTDLVNTFMNFLKPSPMMAYLVQMAIRLVHMHRVLKSTGSLYLHCDPTASHYLKLVLDAVFGPVSFQNEIVWKRTSAHSSAKRYGPVHDTLLFYGKSGTPTWNQQYQPYDQGYVDTFFDQVDQDGKQWKRMDLTGAGIRRGETGLPWHGIDITTKGRHWAYPPAVLDELDRKGHIHWPKKQDGMPRLKQYLDELPGVPLQDVWTDLPPIHNLAAERLGYPTQKPLALLKRVLAASSNPGDVIMDPFCGCGTTIDAVETLNRENPKDVPRTWIGIDVTHLAINLIKHRLTRFAPLPEYEVVGEPASTSGAAALAQDDPFQFQYWALGLVGARPKGAKGKKGADQGIDGVRYFIDEMKGKQPVTRTMLIQVKGGRNVGVKDIRDLVGTMAREKADLGVFITLTEPTKPMKTEAASAGAYESPYDRQSYPRVQILTIDELLADPHKPNPRCLLVPGGAAQHTLPEPKKHRRKGHRQEDMLGE